MAIKSDDDGGGPVVVERRASVSSIISRGNWGNRWEFLLSCVGLSVGIGNVWRFPYLAYANGGGAFLIPYIIMLILAGKPMYFLELAFGQFAGVGPIAIWTCVPIAKGIGYAMMVVTLIIIIYYNVIMSYTVFFVASSFQSQLPWATCDPSWANNTECVVRDKDSNVTLGNKTVTASQAYFERYVLNMSSGLEDIGGIKWDLALCLLFCWIVVTVCLIKGIKTSGKVVYFAATFPYAILLTLMVTGLLQEGAVNGILYFITPTWGKLLDIQVWQAAAGQMFFSLSISMGALIMYSSYNQFSNNVFRDAMVVSVLDTLTSIIAGMVIFSVLGALAHDLGTTVDKVVDSGPGLAFVAYPEALTRLPVPQLFSVLFFIMLFILGLDSEFALMENVLTGLSDEFPILRRNKLKFTIAVSIMCFFVGLIYVTNGGLHVLNMVDTYGGGISVVFIAIVESIAVTWIYGLDQFCEDIKFMLGRNINRYWRITWRITTPIILTFIFVYSMVVPPKLDKKYYPDWADYIGWGLTMLSVLQVPIWAIIMVARQPAYGFCNKFQMSLRPAENWGPAKPEIRALWQAHLTKKSHPVPLFEKASYVNKAFDPPNEHI